MILKKYVIVLCILFASAGIASMGSGEEGQDLNEAFKREYDALVPPPNSSVDSDYRLAQIALGTRYIEESLNRIYTQNKALEQKYDALIQKQNRVIEQNDEIIRLLRLMAKQLPVSETSEIESQSAP